MAPDVYLPNVTHSRNTNWKIAVIIVNWNSGNLLRQCLSCLNKQTFKDFQAIVIQNGDYDDTLNEAKTAMEAVKIVCLGENKGFAAANNIAVQLAKDCDWIALLNPDAFPETDWLENLLRAAQQMSNYAFFGSRMLAAHNFDILDGAGDLYHTSGLVWRRGHGEKGAGAYLEREEVFAPCAAAALYRRDAFLEVGGFDEDYFCYLEDVDVGFRLRLLGYRCLYIPEAVVHHVGSAITGKGSNFSIYHGHRNLVWTYVKNMPAPLFWLYLPQHILLNVATLIWFSCRGQAKVIFKAKWDALFGLPKILRKRRLVQAKKQISSWELRKVMSCGWLKPYFRRG